MEGGGGVLILQSLIPAVAGVVGAWLAVRKGKNEEDQRRAVREQEYKDRLDAIEQKLDEHNGYAKKLGDVEKELVRIRTELKHLEK